MQRRLLLEGFKMSKMKLSDAEKIELGLQVEVGRMKNSAYRSTKPKNKPKTGRRF